MTQEEAFIYVWKNRNLIYSYIHKYNVHRNDWDDVFQQAAEKSMKYLMKYGTQYSSNYFKQSVAYYAAKLRKHYNREMLTKEGVVA